MPKVVVITGAARGLGLEWVKQYSSESDTLVIAVVRDASKANLLDSFVSSGKVKVVEGDMEKFDSFDGVASKIGEAAGGKVDVLINNAGAWFGAGATMDQQITASTPQEWVRTYELNTVGPIFFTKALLPLLSKGELKKVVNISSFLGKPDFHKATDGQFAFVSYSVAKGALDFATLKFQQEFKGQGYTFLSLNPGYVGTDLHKSGKENAPLTPEQSVTRCKSFVDRATTADSGDAFSLEGSREPLVY